MSLNWNEIRLRAKTFTDDFADASYEKGETQTFYNEFFEIFGIKRRSVARYEEHVKKLNNKTGFIDLFWPKVLLVEQKSAGRNLSKAADQAGEYFDAIKDRDKPRFQLLCDFQNFELLDRDTRETASFALADLPKNIEKFAFMLGREKRQFKDQDPVNIEASELMGKIHDALKASGYDGHELEAFLVRLLFMLFADDTGIFEPRDHLLDVVESRTNEDGSDLGMWLQRIFEVLNTQEDQRNKNLDEDLNRFPYVNGDLFAAPLPTADFTSDMRETFLEACRFNWSKVSPAIFGSLFQSVMDPKERRKKGAHYTTEKNIMKLIGPLFLDELTDEFKHLKNLKTGRAGRLEAFRRRLGNLTFLDPACGCGNFLIIAYRELRQLEIDVLLALHGVGTKELFGDTISVLDVDQFYGIELEEFPARIAETAMWMIDHIMNVRLGNAFGQIFTRIPLRKSPQITHGDALELDWNDLLRAEQCSYVFGNPPFIGKKEQSKVQKQQVQQLFRGVRGSGEIDYVACWFRKACAYKAGCTSIRIAFVSTNSITQGEQVAPIWRPIFEPGNLRIFFAHRTFAWTTEARGGAHVHVVIVGIADSLYDSKLRLFDYEAPFAEPEEIEATNINAYLVSGRNIIIDKSRKPISERPIIRKGSEATDWGYLTLEQLEADQLLADSNVDPRWIRPFWGGDEFINGTPKYCLWLRDANPSHLKNVNEITSRLIKLSEKRAKSSKDRTVNLANFPTLFGEERQPANNYILVPKVSSEKRDYIPMGFVDPDVIVSGSAQFIESEERWLFGLLTSAIHMAWMRSVGGRLESRYQYTNTLVYNTFPWPTISPKQKTKISDLAQTVLDARDQFPDSTLADLYDPDLMPPVLRKAHTALDKAVDRLYRTKPFQSERERVEHLFTLYEKMVAPMEAIAKAKPKRRRKTI